MADAFPLVRNTAALKNRRFDLLVIGGGIYGAWTAYDAARRGLSVALIEKNDWASGTSSASSKLIHGGLRYLEHFEFALVRHALTERRVLAKLAPHLVRPLNFVLPLWKGARAGPLKLSAGLFLYDLMGLGRQPVQRHKHFRRERLLKRYPFLAPDGLKSGFRYGDCQEDDARLCLNVVAAAQGAGVVTANRVEAVALIEGEGRIHGAKVRDTETGECWDLGAAVTVTAAGPWTPQLLGRASPKVKLVKGTHLVLPAIPDCQSAFLLTAPQDGRVFFVIPWYGRTLLGTTESTVSAAEVAQPNDSEAQYLLAAASAWLPGVKWTHDDVIARFSGVRALQAQATENLAAVTREFVIETPRAGLIAPIGGKYTTARADAALIVDAVQHSLGRVPTPCMTDRQPLPGGAGAQAEILRDALVAAGVDAEAASWCWQRHGGRCSRLLELLKEHPAWGQRLHPELGFIEAEVVLAVRDEGARSLEDITRRRIPLAILAREDCSEKISRVLARAGSALPARL
ncbi:MAG: glycerol-3-phosphate dehydrogenase/oxidase [Pseudomonadota bacterium]